LSIFWDLEVLVPFLQGNISVLSAMFPHSIKCSQHSSSVHSCLWSSLGGDQCFKLVSTDLSPIASYFLVLWTPQITVNH